MDLKFVDWVTVVAATFTAIPVIWGAFQFIGIKRAEERARQFAIYHGVIQSLVETGIFIDRQIASVYELRRYPSYYPVTYRILKRLRVNWGAPGVNVFTDLVEEMRLTMDFIEKSGHKYKADSEA